MAAIGSDFQGAHHGLSQPKEAGLTVGGFYKHFDSRDDLVAEALGSAVGPWKRLVDAAASGGPLMTYDAFVDDYLSEAHRNHPSTGCPVGALAGDVARNVRWSVCQSTACFHRAFRERGGNAR